MNFLKHELEFIELPQRVDWNVNRSSHSALSRWAAQTHMKTWEKTTMRWDPSAEWITNIPVDDLEDCGNHFIRRMTAVSIPSGGIRVAVLTFDVIRGVIGPTTKRQFIVETLKNLTKESTMRYVHVFENEYGPEFKMTFCLRHQFCEDVLEFMRDFFALLGIEDKTDWRLSNFTIAHETMYAQGAGWIPFEDVFKVSNRLRIGELKIETMPSISALR
ncbi:MAG: hypothetical protein A3B25_00820 [Candidatus Ryanbacteria bacterium RIFCSPLOWO2_01_FULL_48_26]|uniref:Uncharacterized protein n=1 Tax=Candidatus Ryanbacteria bacterium RIFCSPLOWO2_01_FULL_48_26 TaxID=1802126 RepID=A0A1G2GR90_9BACT|nr:MAG: hypothetical protein A3B25_00820 [Candidatus Ryanbacteria bacterium RIFCSPLOWO2_01_FULL_48_26]